MAGGGIENVPAAYCLLYRCEELELHACFHRLEAPPLTLLGVEGDVHSFRVVVPVYQALEPLFRVLQGRFEVVQGLVQVQLTLEPGLPSLEVGRLPRRLVFQNGRCSM